VFVDNEGHLHLRIDHRDDRWSCAEVISTRSFGYGTYRFDLDSHIDCLDPQVVLGLFTWNDDPSYNHREIDIEVARWGDPAEHGGPKPRVPLCLDATMTRVRVSWKLWPTPAASARWRS
jgi:hypothetical protein